MIQDRKNVSSQPRHVQHGSIWNHRKAAHRQGSKLRTAMPAKVGNNKAHSIQLFDERAPVFPIGRRGMEKHHGHSCPGIAKNQRSPV